MVLCCQNSCSLLLFILYSLLIRFEYVSTTHLLRHLQFCFSFNRCFGLGLASRMSASNVIASIQIRVVGVSLYFILTMSEINLNDDDDDDDDDDHNIVVTQLAATLCMM